MNCIFLRDMCMFETKKLFVFNKKKVLEELRYCTWYTYANFVKHVVKRMGAQNYEEFWNSL